MSVEMEKILSKLKNYYGQHHFDVTNRRNPFKTLVSCILSLRTKDEVTFKAAERLFKMIKEPADLASISQRKLEKTIYPVGFYKTKAGNLINIGNRLISQYKGQVPDNIDELLKFKGVGRKTANLVVSVGFGKEGICVDTHVHRISNRLGYVRTKTPLKTEMSLRKKLSKKYWPIINYVLVLHGQQTCKPIGPRCGKCPVYSDCLRIGVKNNKSVVR